MFTSFIDKMTNSLLVKEESPPVLGFLVIKEGLPPANHRELIPQILPMASR